MDVNQYGPAAGQPDPYVQQPGMSPVQPQQFSPPPPSLKKSKKLPIIIAASLLSVIALVVIVVAVMNGENNSPAKQQESSEETSDTLGPQPATAVSTEQTNNSISQDISGVNDDQDFPVDQLSDDQLKL